MSQTKKLLVPFDPAKPKWRPNEYLIPTCQDGSPVLTGLSNGKKYEFGLVVYTGTGVSENDLFAKLVGSGAAIGNVDGTLRWLRSYLDQLQNVKIGNVVRLCPAVENVGSFRLELIANTPSAMGKSANSGNEGGG
jgi:hypothetical protein